MSFYEWLVTKCNETGETPTKVAHDIGLSAASATGWKNGAMPKSTILARIEEHFGCKFEQGGKDILQDLCDTDRALLHSIVELTDEQKKMMQIFIRGLKGEENG